MKKLGIVIDSTVYLSKEIIEKNDINVVSLKVTVNEKTYDETDITREFVIEKRKAGASFQTSAPAPGAFLETYKQMLKIYEHVFVVGLSKELSGTYQSSLLGKNMLDDPSLVTIFDTGSSAYGNELLVHLLLKLIKEENKVDIIEQKMDNYIAREQLMFTCENLFSLVSGGRLTAARAMIGTVLRVKPVIEMHDGKLAHTKSERTYAKIFELIKKRINDSVEDDHKLYIYMTHTNSQDSGDKLHAFITKEFPHAELFYTDALGPVMTVHVGNKGFGIAWTSEE